MESKKRTKLTINGKEYEFTKFVRSAVDRLLICGELPSGRLMPIPHALLTDEGEVLQLTKEEFEEEKCAQQALPTKRPPGRPRLYSTEGAHLAPCTAYLTALERETITALGHGFSSGVRTLLRTHQKQQAAQELRQKRAADAAALHEHRISTPASPDDPSAVLPIPPEPGAELYPPPGDPTTPDYDPDTLTMSDLIPSDDHAAILAGEDPRRA